MLKEINDAVFGKLVYTHSWKKTETMRWCEKDYSVNIIVQAYKDDLILDSQKEMYSFFKKNLDSINSEAVKKLLAYCQDSLKINTLTNEMLFKKIIPKTVVFERNESWGILFDSDFDTENGIAFFIIGNQIKVGTQDLFI